MNQVANFNFSSSQNGTKLSIIHNKSLKNKENLKSSQLFAKKNSDRAEF